MKKVRELLNKKLVLYSSVVFLCLVSWSWVLFTKVTDMSSSPALGYAIAAVAVLINTAVSSYILIKAIQYLQKIQKPGVWFVFKVGAVWAFVEFAVAWLTSLLWLGKDGSIDTLEPFVTLTHPAINTPLIFASRFVGFFGLSAILAMLIYCALSKTHRKYFAPILLGSILLSSLGWILYKTPHGQPVSVTVASQNLSAPQPVTTNADLLVVPEYGLEDVTNENLPQHIKRDKAGETFFVGSTQVVDNSTSHNLITFGSTQKGITHQHPKTRLVPGGEYIPYPVEIPLRLFHANGPLINFAVARAVEKGKQPIKPYVFNQNLVLGSAVCSSIIATEDYRKLSAEGATVLTNSASLGIFKGSPIFTWQHTNLARFMATANARPFVQSSFNGKSFIIDQNGKILASRLPVGTIERSITTNNQRTPYTIIGEWVVLIGGIWVLVDIVKYFKRRQKT